MSTREKLLMTALLLLICGAGWCICEAIYYTFVFIFNHVRVH